MNSNGTIMLSRIPNFVSYCIFLYWFGWWVGLVGGSIWLVGPCGWWVGLVGGSQVLSCEILLVYFKQLYCGGDGPQKHRV